MSRWSLIVVLALATIGRAEGQVQAVAIENVTVIDVERGRAVPGQTVVASGSRIVAVGAARATEVPAGAVRVDGAGKFLIPGLWDMHVHAATPWFGNFFLPLLVAHGVTGIRDLFTTTAAVEAWRDQIAKGAVGPRIGSFGSLVDGDPPIWGPTSVVARSPDEGRRIVDSLKAAKVDFVKVYSRLDPETFRAIAARSKQVGIPFAGHVPQLVAAGEAARLGQRTIEHITQVVMGCTAREDEYLAQSLAAFRSPGKWDSVGVVSRGRLREMLDSHDPARCERLADTFRASGTWLVPTIAVLRSVAYLDDPALATDPRLEYVPTFLKRGWNPKDDFRFKMLTPADWALRKALHARELEVLRVMHRRGVRMLAGTDLANPYIFAGTSLHDELANLVGIGMTPAEALRAATIEPARFLGGLDSMGTVAAGKVADLVLLGADPLRDIKAVGTVELVIAAGRLFDRAAREKILADARAAAAR